MWFFNTNDFYRLVFVVEGKDTISEFTLRMVAKALEKFDYHTTVVDTVLTLSNAHDFFSQYYPDGVIINDFIVDPDTLTQLIKAYPMCKFYVRDIHSNILDKDISDLFNMIIAYIKSGAIVLTTSKCVNEFKKTLPLCNMDPNCIKWAPDIVMPNPFFTIPHMFDREREKFNIGMYVDDIGVSGNIVIPFLGASYFACNNRQPTKFHLLAEHEISADPRMKSIETLPNYFSFIKLFVYNNLKFENFLNLIPHMNVLAHLTLTNTESNFCSLGIRHNVPVLRSKKAPTFLKDKNLVDHESVESIATGFNRIYRETELRRIKSLFKQNKWLCEYNSKALKMWREFLPHK